MSAGPSAEEAAELRETIDDQVSHLTHLIDDLLDVSRITRGKFELRKEDLDLRRAIEAAIESTMPRRAERRIELERVATPGSSWEGPQFVRADRSGHVRATR